MQVPILSNIAQKLTLGGRIVLKRDDNALSSNKQAITLGVITFLLVILICSSVAKFEVFARPPATARSCTPLKPTAGMDSAERCCYTTTFFDFYGRPTESDTACEVCEYGNDGSQECTTFWHHLSNAPPFSPSNSITPPPPTTNTLQPSTGGLLNKAPQPPTSTFNAPITSGNPSNQQQSRQQLQAPPQQQQPTTTTCPDGSQPDANGNCPSNSTTTTNNQQISPPTTSTEHHHKGSNLLGGGQELTTKKGTNNNGNSPTPPPCPEGNEPIPPNCTLKPKF
jgi:hypothetical protein